MIKTKLFCLPYAGGSADIYSSWKKFLDYRIDLVPLEFSGRGNRIQEPIYEKRSDLVDDIFRYIRQETVKTPYMIFGHSLGALVAYEVIQKIRLNKLPIPSEIFFSGSSAPNMRSVRKIYHRLDEDNFKKELLNLGGTSPEFFDSPELMNLFLPILKNDFKLAETDFPSKIINPIGQDIVVFYGEDDNLTSKQLNGWEEYTSKRCYRHGFPGGHFFINQSKIEIIEIINSKFTGGISSSDVSK